MADKMGLPVIDVSSSGNEQPVNFRPRIRYPLTHVVAITELCVMITTF
jgi:hypothetical protein